MPFSRKPKKFDYNLIVIGGGAAGLVTSNIAATLKAKVALVEADKMGGDCLNTGCVPSKTFIKSAHLLHQIKQHKEYGLDVAGAQVDFNAVMQRVKDAIQTIEPHDSAARYRDLGVDVYESRGIIKDRWRVEIDGQIYTTQNIVIATGATPRVPEIKGLETMFYYTSETIWNIKNLPENLLVMGAGPVGCELAQAFQRLGSRVTLVDRGERILKKEDVDVSDLLLKTFQSENIKVHLDTQVTSFADGYAHLSNGKKVETDAVFLALGRAPNLKNLGIENLNLKLNENQTLNRDAFLRTSIKNIFIIGDAGSSHQYTHVGAHEAWYAAVNALLGRIKKFKADCNVVPRVTFTDPEIATVGLTESQAIENGIKYHSTTFEHARQDRAVTENEMVGFTRILTKGRSDKIIGATIVGAHAGETLAGVTLAMTHNIGLNKVLQTIHAYPTHAERFKLAAGAWKKSHKPEWAISLLKRFFDWTRS